MSDNRWRPELVLLHYQSRYLLAGGAVTWLENKVLQRNDPLRFFLDLSHIESEERLGGLDGVTTPCHLA